MWASNIHKNRSKLSLVFKYVMCAAKKSFASAKRRRCMKVASVSQSIISMLDCIVLPDVIPTTFLLAQCGVYLVHIDGSNTQSQNSVTKTNLVNNIPHSSPNRGYQATCVFKYSDRKSSFLKLVRPCDTVCPGQGWSGGPWKIVPAPQPIVLPLGRCLAMFH